MGAPETAHVAFGLASLALGVGVFSLPKGQNVHRAVGALYVLSMVGLNVTALAIYRVFGGFGVFHVLALINLALLLAGFGAVLLQGPHNTGLDYHYYFMCWSYVGLVAATATEVTVRVVKWPLAFAVLVPTISVTILGGSLVQFLKRRTMLRVTSRLQ